MSYLWAGENDGTWLYVPPIKDEDMKDDDIYEDKYLYTPPITIQFPKEYHLNIRKALKLAVLQFIRKHKTRQ